jgi:hypothetical protein
MSPVSFSTISSTSCSPETKEKGTPKFLHLIPQELHG